MSLNNNTKNILNTVDINAGHSDGFIIGIANEEERDHIYQMRHSIYAEELAQHEVNETGRLQDKLDAYNTYIVARKHNQVAGFVSITGPGSHSFSVDKYFDRSLVPFPFDKYLYEIRLLSIDKAWRNSALALLLMYAAKRWVEAHGGRHIVAICRSDIMKMYINAGLVPLNNSIKSGEVVYELSLTSIERLNEVVQNKMKAFKMLQTKTTWKFPFSFFAPAPCYHGGAFFTAIGEDLQTLHKKENIINADVLDAWFPPSPKVISALQNDLAWLLQTSPPTHNSGLISVIAKVRGVEDACILPGAGSSDLIFLGLQNLLYAGSKVLILDPCYGEYRHVLDNIIHCRVHTFPLLRADGFVVDTIALLKEIQKGYDLVILINPNSPTGLHVAKDKMEEMLLQIPATTLVWIDETYIEYAGKSASLEQFATGTENVIICKSMSKVYALSGARVAYLCAAPHLLEAMKSLSPPWSVSLPAQLAAIKALHDEQYYADRYRETHELREAMRNSLLRLGIKEIIPGMANFLLFYLSANITDVTAFIDRCRTQGLFIRDVSNMGKTLGAGALRIAIKDNETNDRLMTIMQAALLSEGV
jgi:histidinol-phosphate/aromatic aminotransferase/cobyric acid decarboxylase-like protein